MFKNDKRTYLPYHVVNRHHQPKDALPRCGCGEENRDGLRAILAKLSTRRRMQQWQCSFHRSEGKRKNGPLVQILTAEQRTWRSADGTTWCRMSADRACGGEVKSESVVATKSSADFLRERGPALSLISVFYRLEKQPESDGMLVFLIR